jgi:type IV secretion system protein VirB11
LRAANSGHPGNFSTVHADTLEACFDQMVIMIQQAGSTSSDINLRNYIKSVVNIVVQVKRCSSQNRFMHISEIYFDAIHESHE